MLKCLYFKDNLCRSCSFIQDSGEISSNLPSIPIELSRLANKVNPWVTCESPFNSRAKAKLSVSGTSAEPVIGILDADLLGVELLNCPLHKTIINNFLIELKKSIQSVGLTPYSIHERSGELKGVIIQTNMLEDHVRMRFVLRSMEHRNKVELIASQLSAQSSTKISLSINIQAVPHQILEGPQEVHIHGEELLWETYGSTKVAFPSQSFMQVTPDVASKLYKTAARVVANSKLTSVVDLYCGAGGFALSLSPFVKKAYGIEISKPAILAAKHSAREAGFTNIEFVDGNLLNSVEILNDIQPEVLICNPPRRGLGSAVVEAIKESLPELIVYSSCQPESLIKDVSSLSDLYDLEELTPFEMFPLTKHFEVLAILVRR